MRRGPEIPAAHANDYHQAIARLTECANLHRDGAWDRPMLLSVAAALAVAKGHVAVAEALLNLDDEWISKIIKGEYE